MVKAPLVLSLGPEYKKEKSQSASTGSHIVPNLAAKHKYILSIANTTCKNDQTTSVGFKLKKGILKQKFKFNLDPGTEEPLHYIWRALTCCPLRFPNIKNPLW